MCWRNMILVKLYPSVKEVILNDLPKFWISQGSVTVSPVTTLNVFPLDINLGWANEPVNQNIYLQCWWKFKKEIKILQ